MPLYRFKCPNEDCGATRKVIRKADKVDVACVVCEKCGDFMDRDSKGPGTQVMETLDNGIMVKKVERLADAERIHHERAHGKKGVI